MNISKLLREAIEAVDGANIPTDLRAVAFEKAIDLMIRLQGGYSGSSSLPGLQQVQSGSTPASNSSPGNTYGGSEVISVLSDKLGLEEKKVADVYHYEADKEELTLILPADAFPQAMKAATQQLALLVAGGNQLCGLEEWTSVKSIKDMVVHYGKLDRPNFAKSVSGMGNVFGFKGKGQQREVKLNRLGHDELAKLIQRILDGDR